MSKISASLMCANPYNLGETIAHLEREGVDYLHIDMMDGHFVPNLGFSIDFVKMIRKKTNLPCDFHLMLENPLKIIPNLALKKGDIVSIHFEANYYITELLKALNSHEARIFLALNPHTPICILDKIASFISGINFLTINPGFFGQKINEKSLMKFKKLLAYLKTRKLNLSLEVDGNMSVENIAKFRNADIFVLGTSSIFPNNKLDLKMLKTLKNLTKEQK